jgi:PAS domain S-box-containing protein
MGVAILDPAGTIIETNAAWCRFADQNGGRDPRHFVGWNYLSQCDRVPVGSVDAPSASAAALGLRSVLAGVSDSYALDYPCHATGFDRWMRMEARSFSDGSRRVAAIVHEDVTLRVLAERTRDQQLALLRAVFASALDAIVTTDVHGTIKAANPAAERMFGYGAGELHELSLSTLLSLPKLLRRAGLSHEDGTTANFSTGGIEHETMGQRRDGKRFPLLLRVSEARVEDQCVFTALLHDLSEQKALEAERLERQKRELVVQELGHRITNIFATVTSVAQMLARTSTGVTEYRDALMDRLHALAATQLLLTGGARRAIMLDELVAFELAAYVAEGRVVNVVGEGVRLSAESGQLLGMALHELATNSAKYGALATSSGRLSIRWRCSGKGAARRLVLSWVERGGRPVTPPTRKGFGTTLIERSLRSGLGAEVVLDYAPEGLTCRIEAPMSRLSDAGCH